MYLKVDTLWYELKKLIILKIKKKNNFDCLFVFEKRPIPANEKTQLIPKKQPIIEVIKFAWSVCECIILGFIALIGAYLTTGQIIPGFI